MSKDQQSMNRVVNCQVRFAHIWLFCWIFQKKEEIKQNKHSNINLLLKIEKKIGHHNEKKNLIFPAAKPQAMT